jgi:hypothetical protein
MKQSKASFACANSTQITIYCLGQKKRDHSYNLFLDNQILTVLKKEFFYKEFLEEYIEFVEMKLESEKQERNRSIIVRPAGVACGGSASAAIKPYDTNKLVNFEEKQFVTVLLEDMLKKRVNFTNVSKIINLYILGSRLSNPDYDLSSDYDLFILIARSDYLYKGEIIDNYYKGFTHKIINLFNYATNHIAFDQELLDNILSFLLELNSTIEDTAIRSKNINLLLETIFDRVDIDIKRIKPLVKKLLSLGADINYQRETDANFGGDPIRGQTYLIGAVRAKLEGRIRFLIENGADTKIEDISLRKAVDYTNGNGNLMMALERHPEFLKALRSGSPGTPEILHLPTAQSPQYLPALSLPDTTLSPFVFGHESPLPTVGNGIKRRMEGQQKSPRKEGRQISFDERPFTQYDNNDDFSDLLKVYDSLIDREMASLHQLLKSPYGQMCTTPDQASEYQRPTVPNAGAGTTQGGAFQSLEFEEVEKMEEETRKSPSRSK